MVDDENLFNPFSQRILVHKITQLRSLCHWRNSVDRPPCLMFSQLERIFKKGLHIEKKRATLILMTHLGKQSVKLIDKII